MGDGVVHSALPVDYIIIRNLPLEVGSIQEPRFPPTGESEYWSRLVISETGRIRVTYDLMCSVEGRNPAAAALCFVEDV